MDGVISKCEDISDGFLRKTRKYLPTVGRLLLVSTFIEDGLRLLFNTRDHAAHYARLWDLNFYVAYCFTVFSFVTLLVAPVMILLRRKVRVLCALLTVLIFIQLFLYTLHRYVDTIIRTISVMAALLLITIEDELQKPKQYDPLPKDETKLETSSVLLFVCRCCLNLMLISMVRYEMNLQTIIITGVSNVMILAMWCGYKSKMMSVLLAAWLFIINVAGQDFWNKADPNSIRYEFFQTLTVIGGLLVMMHTGPGDISLDHMKKKW